MLTAVNPRGPASEPLRRCSVLPELMEEGIVATAEVILTNAARAVAENIKSRRRPDCTVIQAPTFRRCGDEEDRSALNRSRDLAPRTSRRASQRLIEATLEGFK